MISAQVVGPDRVGDGGGAGRRRRSPVGLALGDDRRTRSRSSRRPCDFAVAIFAASDSPSTYRIAIQRTPCPSPVSYTAQMPGWSSSRGDLGLAAEPLDGDRSAARPESLQDLERDLPVEPRVLGEVDGALAAAADLADDPVGADAIACGVPPLAMPAGAEVPRIAGP